MREEVYMRNKRSIMLKVTKSVRRIYIKIYKIKYSVLKDKHIKILRMKVSF